MIPKTIEQAKAVKAEMDAKNAAKREEYKRDFKREKKQQAKYLMPKYWPGKFGKVMHGYASEAFNENYKKIDWSKGV